MTFPVILFLYLFYDLDLGVNVSGGIAGLCGSGHRRSPSSSLSSDGLDLRYRRLSFRSALCLRWMLFRISLGLRNRLLWIDAPASGAQRIIVPIAACQHAVE
jgi:hypothetical protein